MALNISNFVPIGVRELKVYSLTDGSLVNRITHLKTSGLENTGDSVKVSGGENNKTLLVLSGNKQSSITFTSASSNPKLLAMQTGQGEVIEQTNEAVEVTEQLEIANDSVTITNETTGIKAVMVGDKIYKAATGASPQDGEYKAADKVITFATGTKGRATVVYLKNMETQTIIQTGANTVEDYRIVVDMIIKNIKDKKVYISQLIAPCATIDQNFNQNASNDGGEPEATSIKFDLMEDEEVGYSWKQVFFTDTRNA